MYPLCTIIVNGVHNTFEYNIIICVETIRDPFTDVSSRGSHDGGRPRHPAPRHPTKAIIAIKSNTIYSY